MAPKVKLIYFDSWGAGEPIRYLLAYGNIEYEDYRVLVEDWPKVKTSMPFGQIPVLEWDEKVLYQSTSICRFLAKKMGLAGDDDWEAQEIDALADTIADLKQAINEYGWYCSRAERPIKKQKLIKETLPFILSRFEKRIGENNGYLANGKLSYADFIIAGSTEYFSVTMGFDITDGYPKLKALVDKVHKFPQIQAWVEKRPKNVYAFKMDD
ncbi:Glutathione S-transferase [Gryllus bimaculatus]|nr:Glutathione S-transferase [Gryllus bimaculatus]